MLEDLDKIDWSKIGHAIKIGSEEIPNVLHELIDNAGHIDEIALEHLFWDDEIYESTPYLVPYVLEILPRTDDAGKALLLGELGEIIRSAYGGHSPWEMRSNLRVYDAITLATPTFLRLLENSNDDVRRQAAFVLGAIYQDTGTILDKLAQNFQSEQNDRVRLEILSSISSQIGLKQSNFEYHGGRVNASKALEKNYVEFFRAVLISSASLSIRRHAAGFLLYNAYPNGLLSELMPKLYPKPHEASVMAAEALVDDYSKYSNSLSDHLIKDSIIHVLHKAGTTYLLRIKALQGLSVEEAQWIVISLARIAFGSRFSDYQRDIDSVENLIREKRIGGTTPPQQSKLYPQQYTFVRTVLDYDLFWEQPSYILSLYCGLPDSRDELRKLIAES